MKILISGNTEVYRKGLAGVIIDSLDDVEISDSRHYAELLDVLRLESPDLVLASFPLEGASSDLAIRNIRSAAPAAPLVVLAATHDKSLIANAFNAGAVGYLLSGCSIGELLATIENVLKGGTLKPSGPDPVESIPAHPKRGNLNMLSPRQVEIGSLIAVGFANQQIADELEIAVGTVKNHVHMILSILHAANRTEAAAKLSQMGLIPTKRSEFAA